MITGRPKLPASAKRSYCARVTLTPKEWKVLLALAQKLGLTVSKTIRQTLADKL
jgi:DNA-binding MarR family transcriptional regulator